MSLAARWSELEAPFRETEHRGTDEADALFWHGPGRRQLLFTAPHAVRPWRNGVERHADYSTGGLAALLAEITGGLALAAFGRQSGDPNRDLQPAPFKQALLDAVDSGWTVVDLHGMNERHPEDLILGQGPLPQLAARLARAISGCGLAVRAGKPFDATWPGTITATLQGIGVQALQVEVSSRRRMPRRSPEFAGALVAALLGVL